jgi:hypothetical protein
MLYSNIFDAAVRIIPPHAVRAMGMRDRISAKQMVAIGERKVKKRVKSLLKRKK